MAAKKRAAPRKLKATDEIAGLMKSGLVMTGDDPRLEIKRLTTGIPQLDTITGGGIPYNRVVALVGPETTGKTTIMQYIAAAVNKTDRPYFLLMDCEKSYDRGWWEQSGVDVTKLMVSQPVFGEEAIDVMVAALKASELIGGVGLDSIPAMVPKVIVESDSAEDKFIGRLPALVNVMLAKMMPLIQNCVFVHCNQMRANVGGHEEIYPGGMGLKHGTHLRLRTRREGWLKEGSERVGFIMEVMVPKNKCGVPYGECQIPFRFQGQLDFIQSYIDEAIQQQVILQRLPYYRWEEMQQQWMGKTEMRDYFVENKGALALLKSKLKTEAA